MVSFVAIALASLAALYGVSQYRALQRNLRAARESGLKYVVAPVFFQSILWILLQEALLPLLQRLPPSLTSSWLPLSLFYRTWAAGYKPFEKQGVDTFLIVSPAGNVLWTCDPDVTMQLLSTRHEDFIKPTDMLGMLNIYGPTITASEGDEHRRYRKIAAPSLSESTHYTVWSEAISQAQLMLEHWNRQGGVVEDINTDTNRYTLNILSKAFFDKPMTWDDDALARPPGHELSYPEAINTVFKYNSTLFMTPRPVLSHETSANTMIFALGLLACRPDFQKALQADIDDILGDRDPALWRYPQDYTRLMDGHVGALINEALRLYTVLPFLPKTNPKAQALTVNGTKHVIAPNTLAIVNTSAIHRHPKHWAQPSLRTATSAEGAPYPLASFCPEYWLAKRTPTPGAFIPFAEGFRCCMGSRFARIELCAALASICRQYTVELKEGTSKAALSKGVAQLSSGVGFEMGLKMKDPMALRFVDRR